jgi:flagellar hook-associated protein 2
MIYFSGSSGVRSLYDLGITMNNDGTLSLNADTLDSVLNASYSSVVSFFQDAGAFGRSLSSTLNNLGNVYSSGVLTLAGKENTSLEKTLTDKIANQETLISSQKDALTTELNKANETLQAIPDQLSYVNKIYAAAFNYNGKS